MKSSLIALVALCLSSTTAAVQAETDNPVEVAKISVQSWIQGTPLQIVAHRGCWRGTAENSLLALANCSALGIKAAEGDIHSTKDGTLVWFHDDTLDRTTNRTGRLADYNYTELKSARLKVGNGGPNASLTDQRLPTFADVLAASQHMILFLDVKENIYDAVFREVERAHAEGRVVFMYYGSTAGARTARFLHRSAFIPILFQCQPGQTAGACYSAEQLSSGEAFQGFRDLGPLAFWFPEITDERVGNALGDLAHKAGWRFADCADGDAEADNAQKLKSAWLQEMAWSVSILVTNWPAELAKEFAPQR